MLPPPRSKRTPCSTGRPVTAPTKPYQASRSPEMMATSRPSSVRIRSKSAGAFSASRSAAVATARLRSAPAPTEMARKSRRTSMVRSMASSLSA